MLRNPKVQRVAILVLGVLLGYAAATGNLRLSWSAGAAPAEGQVTTNPPAAEPAPCCWEGNARGLLLARADNQAGDKRPGGGGGKDGMKPNILVIWGDDIGYWNISAYNRRVMGYRTPNIDRIAKEGALFTDCYAQQSCTAGRAAFITGQSPFRTGLLKVGLPGAKEGLSEKDPTIADLLKPLGYVCGQFGKNHLGDRQGPPRRLRPGRPVVRQGAGEA
jgi:hypothetical protein